MKTTVTIIATLLSRRDYGCTYGKLRLLIGLAFDLHTSLYVSEVNTQKMKKKMKIKIANIKVISRQSILSGRIKHSILNLKI